MKLITLDDIRGWKPCNDYVENDEALLLQLADGRDGWTLLELLQRADIPPADRVWLATRADVLPRATLVEFANLTADRAVHNHAVGSCIDDWAQDWLSGKDRSAKAALAARAAAWAKAWAATKAADAWAATKAAGAAWAAVEAKAAARAAVRDAAARAAVRDAAAWAWDAAAAAAAAREAAAGAERQQQVNDLITNAPGA